MAKSNNPEFPLVLWTETQAFRSERAHAMEKYERIRQAIADDPDIQTNLGDLRLRWDGKWVTDVLGVKGQQTIYRPRRLSIRAALDIARAYGAPGWWTIAACDAFLAGKGPVVEKAMRSLGYIPVGEKSRQWMRLLAKRRVPEFVSSDQAAVRPSIVYPPSADLAQTLRPSWLRSNEKGAASDQTFISTVNSRGWVYITSGLEIGGAFTPSEYGLHQNEGWSRAHLASQQPYFELSAENVIDQDQPGLQITASLNNGEIRQLVWPRYLPKTELFGLAEKLKEVVLR